MWQVWVGKIKPSSGIVRAKRIVLRKKVLHCEVGQEKGSGTWVEIPLDDLIHITTYGDVKDRGYYQVRYSDYTYDNRVLIISPYKPRTKIIKGVPFWEVRVDERSVEGLAYKMLVLKSNSQVNKQERRK